MKFDNLINTDLGVFREMLDKAGVVYEITSENEEINLTIGTKDGPKNDGYVGFVASFLFKLDGRLDSTGVWE